MYMLMIFYNIYFYSRKNALWYRMVLSKKESVESPLRTHTITYLFSQLPPFPPQVWQNLGNYFLFFIGNNVKIDFFI